MSFKAPAASTLRLARPDDIDGIVDVMLLTSSLDPNWDFIFSYRHEYPEDYYKYTKIVFESYLRPGRDDKKVMVIEAPSHEDPNVSKIVAISVWDVSYMRILNYSKPEPQNRKKPSHTLPTLLDPNDTPPM